jgi:indole-3-glycerol phosphate synthase
MHSQLEQILAQKRRELEILKEMGISADHINGIPPLRDFRAAISRPDKIALISEIKFASPSEGIIREPTDPIAIGRLYEAAGASAISLVTDESFFKGDLKTLPGLKKAISLPILRKDFILDEIQLMQSVLYGADAVLLIARILSRQRLEQLLLTCEELGLTALTEIHDRDDLEKAIDAGADIIGINNRDLDTFDVNIWTTIELCDFVPDHCIMVSESGIYDAVDIQVLKGSGILAILVGSSLMKSENISETTKAFVEACSFGKRA